MDFYQFLRELNETKSVSLLHDISNKFNLLALSLEDIDDLLEESEDMIKKESLEDTYRDIKNQKAKFINILNELKSQIRSPEQQAKLKTIFDVVISTHQKKLRENNLSLSLECELETCPLNCGLELLHLMVGLRLLLASKGSVNTTLKVPADKKELLSQEKTMASQIGEDFQKHYLTYIGQLVSWL